MPVLLKNAEEREPIFPQFFPTFVKLRNFCADYGFHLACQGGRVHASLALGVGWDGVSSHESEAFREGWLGGMVHAKRGHVCKRFPCSREREHATR